VNVAVAWACISWHERNNAPPRRHVPISQEAALRFWDRFAPTGGPFYPRNLGDAHRGGTGQGPGVDVLDPHLPGPWYFRLGWVNRWFGYEETLVIAVDEPSVPYNDERWYEEPPSTYLRQWSSGWPCKSLRMQVGSGVDPVKRVSGIDRRAYALAIRRQAGLVCLPYAPRWPEFAVNTLFYTALLWLLFLVSPAKLRRHLRIRRSLCPVCKYPVGTSSMCTECGSAVQPSE